MGRLRRPTNSGFIFGTLLNRTALKAGVRLFRDTPVTEIRSYFQWLADKGYGVVRGDLETLEFSEN